MSRPADPSRRRFVIGWAYAGAALALPPWAPRALALIGQERGGQRPEQPLGVQSGDVDQGRAVVWGAADRPARMIVEWSQSERMTQLRRVLGPAALPEAGGTARTVLTDLPAGRDIFYRVTFQDLGDLRTLSAPVSGRLRTAPADARDVSFAWSGDTAGQGWGINRAWGGMKIYETIRRLRPDFFIHCGDLIYADGPISPEVPLPEGGVWRNVTTEEKAEVAQTLEQFRGAFRYNLLDDHVRRFAAEVPTYVQWDDHEVHNNWYPERILDDPRYAEKSCALLSARARRAFFDYTPIGPAQNDPERIYRVFRRGPLLDVFLLDMRSYRGANDDNRQALRVPEADFLGARQLGWLKEQLRRSRATWKVIAADMPLGLVVWHDARRKRGAEAMAQGDGPPRGRELELVDLLRHLKRHRIANVVFLTADVHYPATHRYDPGRAQFTDFLPFHEFVSGPLHAGAFGPNRLDNTFGPEVLYSRPPPRQNLPPTAGHLHFGHVKIDGRSRVMTVSHIDLSGQVLHRIDLAPERR